MAPPAAALAAIAAFAAAAFPGCTSSQHSSKAACAQARIGGKTVCLKPGVRCEPPHERVYRAYGLTCKGSRLRERNYIGPGNP